MYHRRKNNEEDNYGFMYSIFTRCRGGIIHMPVRNKKYLVLKLVKYQQTFIISCSQ